MRRAFLLIVPAVLATASCVYGQEEYYSPNHEFMSQDAAHAPQGSENYHHGGAGFDSSYADEMACGKCRRCRRISPMAKWSAADSEWLWDSCDCNGSYKFPVPPLYTYHWPGLYAHRLMTDYHSPWRFPGLRPYKEEAPGYELSLIAPGGGATVEAKADRNTAEPGRIEPISQKVMRIYR